jgi:hypothetical protein
VLDAIRVAADAVSRDPRYAALCLEPPRIWGVVASAADIFTCRVSVRTATTERAGMARILREEVARRLQAVGVFAAVGSVPAPNAATPSTPPGDKP